MGDWVEALHSVLVCLFFFFYIGSPRPTIIKISKQACWPWKGKESSAVTASCGSEEPVFCWNRKREIISFSVHVTVKASFHFQSVIPSVVGTHGVAVVLMPTYLVNQILLPIVPGGRIPRRKPVKLEMLSPRPANRQYARIRKSFSEFSPYYVQGETGNHNFVGLFVSLPGCCMLVCGLSLVWPCDELVQCHPLTAGIGLRPATPNRNKMALTNTKKNSITRQSTWGFSYYQATLLILFYTDTNLENCEPNLKFGVYEIISYSWRNVIIVILHFVVSFCVRPQEEFLKPMGTPRK